MKTPKRIYYRTLSTGKLSFGEYIRAKWYNICDPFKPTELTAIQSLLANLEHYKKKENRAIEFVAYDSTPLPYFLT